MSYARHGRRLGVCLVAALGLMGLMAAGAQATWLVNGATLAAKAGKAVEVLNHSAVITKLIPAKNLAIDCKLVHSDDGLLNPASGVGEILGTLLLTECTTLQPIGTAVAKCKLKEPEEIKGKGNLFLHNGDTYILLEPEEGIFTRVDFPEECALPDTNIAGSIVLECLGPNLEKGKDLCLKEEVTHLFQEAPSSLFAGQTEGGVTLPKDGLLYGVSPLTIDGVVKATLASKETWAGHI
jgi:hypothetical protein